jgi:hypothetical protein
VVSVGNSGEDEIEEGDLVSYRDDGGAQHLLIAWMDYPAYRAEEHGGDDPKYGFHPHYYSDHPGAFVPRSGLHSALDDLRRLTWYMEPFRQALERSTSLTIRSRVAVDEVLAELPVTEFLTAETGKPCPRSGRWIMRGADRIVEVEAGDLMPGHAYFANHPPQWTRWDLPLD